MLKLVENNSKWYSEGLRFECTGCGKCCTGSPGYVWVDEEEIEKIAEFLELSVDIFSSRYIRKVNGRFALIEMAKNFDCVFLKDNRCSIYAARPLQCRA